MSDAHSLYPLAAGFGVLAGMRSLAAPALLARRLADHPGRGVAARLLGTSAAPPILAFFAMGEAAADKTPVIPARIEPPALAGRIAMGALCGAAVAGRRGGSPFGAALVAAAAAVASTYGAYYLRKAAGERLPVPDAVLGAVEDVVVLGSGAWLASRV